MKILKKLTTFFLNRKNKKVLLSDFAKQVEVIASEYNRPFYQVSIEFGHHIYTLSDNTISHTKVISFTCYVDGYSRYSGQTISESVNKLLEAVSIDKKEMLIPEVII